MSKVEYTLGTGYTADGRAISNAPAREHEALGEIARTFGGYSSQHLDGGWIDPRGRLVTEPALQVSVYVNDADLPRVHDVAEYLRKQFDQDTVLLARTKIDALEYVTGKPERVAA